MYEGKLLVRNSNLRQRLEVTNFHPFITPSLSWWSFFVSAFLYEIAKHILNIYETDELEKDPTCAIIAQVRRLRNGRGEESYKNVNFFDKPNEPFKFT